MTNWINGAERTKRYPSEICLLFSVVYYYYYLFHIFFFEAMKKRRRKQSSVSSQKFLCLLEDGINCLQLIVIVWLNVIIPSLSCPFLLIFTHDQGFATRSTIFQQRFLKAQCNAYLRYDGISLAYRPFSEFYLHQWGLTLQQTGRAQCGLTHQYK